MANKIIYDWLSFTSKIHSQGNIVDLLGFSELTFRIIPGAHGYKDRLYYDKVSIHYNGREDMGVWCELSGQGCRNFETFGHGDYERLFDFIAEHDNVMNLTRLDVAYDDFDGLLDLDLIIEYVQKQYYISPFREWQIVLGSKGNSILLGSPKSDILIRIYDKAKERGFEDGRHWVRLEIQMRRKLAENFANLNMSISEKFFSVLNNYLRFLDPNENESNKSRWDTAPFWLDFLESLQRISIYEKPGTEYNEFSLENYVMKQAGNSIHTYIECFGKDKFFDELQHRGTMLNKKQEYLIDKHKTVQKDIYHNID